MLWLASSAEVCGARGAKGYTTLFVFLINEIFLFTKSYLDFSKSIFAKQAADSESASEFA